MPWKQDPQNAPATFPIPDSNPADYYKGSAAAWPKSSMTTSRIPTTTIEQVQKQAQLQAQGQQDRLGEFRLQDVRAGSHVPKDGK